MARERAEIRAALTPENQKVFDANAKTMEQRRAEWSKKAKGARGSGGPLADDAGSSQS
jgi:hypothetical protein